MRCRAIPPAAAAWAMVCALSSAAADAPAPPQPTLIYGNDSAAFCDGARGMLFNPAAIGVRYPLELLLTSARSGNRSLEIRDGVLAWGGLGLRAQRVRHETETYGVGVAGGDERLRLGLTWEWIEDARTREVEADHALGALARPHPWLSLGAVVNHASQPVFRGGVLSRTYTLALGIRPLALSRPIAAGWGTRLTFTSDCVVPEGGGWGKTRVRIGGELEPIPGLMLRGAVEDHGGLHLALGVSAPQAGLHSRTARAHGRHRDDTHALSFHAGEEPTAFAGAAARRVAVVRVGGELGDDALAGVSLYGTVSTTPVRPIHRQLERALEDPLTRGVLLEMRGATSMAQLEELRPRIARLRAAGKPVVAYLEHGGGRGDLLLAGACDRIVTSEEADFAALGLRVERRYWRRLLAAWGVRVDRSSYGRYKSAFRNLSVDSIPAPDREAIEHNLDVSQELFVSTLSRDRGIPRERLLTLLDGRAWPAEDVRRAGLLDSIGYREDALRVLGALCRLGREPRTAKPEEPAQRSWNTPSRVAVVYASGGIETGGSGNDLLTGPFMGSETLAAQLESAFENPEVRAVVMRVESPGGSVLGSKLIAHAAERWKRKTGKPLIVSMGGVAASGGYAISLPGDRLFADRYTYTGSIGVLTLKPSFEGWLARHRVHEDDFERGSFMRGWSYARDWDAALQASADSAIRATYHRFVADVSRHRGLSVEEVDRVAQGRVWMGEDARSRRLVDEIGGLEDAIAEARRRAGIPAGEKIRIAEYRRPEPPFFQRVIGRWVRDAWARSVHLPEPGALYYLSDVEEAP